MKNIIWALALISTAFCSSAQANLILTGVIDGDFDWW